MSNLDERNPLAKAIRNALLASAAVSVAAAPTVMAEETEDGADEHKVTITGSRIKRSDVETAAPVQLITREQIEQTGLTSIGDILQNIPAAGSAINTVFNNGGDGSTSIDLRNLGSNRLLVLVNGRRWTAGISGRVDLNNIPVSIIERVEVLKDGASAIYGSDAITGVVNIVTRTDVQGMEAEVYTGAFDEGDGETEHYNFGVGMTGEKGSAYVNVSYTQQKPVMAGDRPISAVPVFGAPTNYAGSSGTPLGRFVYYDPGYNSFFNQTLTGVNGGFAPWVEPTSRYNYAPENFLLTPQERTNLYAQVSYELSDNMNFRSEVFYGNRKSDQLLAPTPLFIGLFAGGLGAQTVIGANNPFNPLGYALDSTCSSGGTQGCLLLSGRRQIEAGHRDFIQDVDHWQWSAGVNGSFEAGDQYFEWDFNYTHSDIQDNTLTEGLLNMQRVNASLADACVTDTSCVPLNLFGGSSGVVGDLAGSSITQEMLDYILFTAQDTTGSSSNDYTFNITGELFEMGGGSFAFAAGLAKRTESGYDQPDALIAAGITSGNSRLPTSGTYSVEEAYVEISAPIVEDLEFSVATRYSDYSNFGDTTNSKVGIKYDVTDDLAIRGTWSEAFRAPSIFELFQGRGDSFPTLSDPCTNYLATGDANIIANCQADGVPAGYIQPNSQIRITVGGNPDLGPEDAESTTFGIVYSPSFVDNLSMTLDWYRIEIENAVSTVGAQTILNECYTNAPGDRALCEFISRNSGGSVTDLFNGRLNVDDLFSEGADMNVSYKMDTGFGEMAFNWDMSYVHENGQVVTDEDGNSVDIQFAGRAFDRVVLPRIRSNFQTVWTEGDLQVSWLVRYVHHTVENCPFNAAIGEPENLCNNPVVDASGNLGGLGSTNTLSSSAYHDVQMQYNLADYNTTLQVGINNIGDKQPSPSFTTFANSFDPTMYDVPGRVWYVRLMHDF